MAEANRFYTFMECDNASATHYKNDSVLYFLHGGAVVAAEVLTTTTAFLSIAGCLLIIITYLAYKDLRTVARTMLVHLSLADIIISLSRVLGLYVNYMRYSERREHHWAHYIYNSTSDPRCYTQAAFTVYGSIASLLWSNAIGIYMVVLLAAYKKSRKRNLIIFITACFICWLLPLIIVIGDGLGHRFGFVVVTLTGCYIRSIPFINDSSIGLQMAELFSYDIWVYLSLLLLPVMYSVLFYFTHCKYKEKPWRGIPDLKLLLVPLVFLLTRIWSVALRAVIYYRDPSATFNSCSATMQFLVIVDGIGINTQGAVNAVLFCIFTRPVRMRMWRSCKGAYRSLCFCFQEDHDDEKPPTEWDSLKELTTSSYESLK